MLWRFLGSRRRTGCEVVTTGAATSAGVPTFLAFASGSGWRAPPGARGQRPARRAPGGAARGRRLGRGLDLLGLRVRQRLADLAVVAVDRQRLEAILPALGVDALAALDGRPPR